ncbi:hypothetical protein RRG08_014470 [Elysia crispata]|uniref:Uncharacterized protein n=1 Tax=Elysia crispata TaxID=231223 RepID=A0AAE0Y5H8_9GAST|nr:hypothetical protein RRG08_014470 [Elysia crispata]
MKDEVDAKASRPETDNAQTMATSFRHFKCHVSRNGEHSRPCSAVSREKAEEEQHLKIGDIGRVTDDRAIVEQSRGNKAPLGHSRAKRCPSWAQQS